MWHTVCLKTAGSNVLNAFPQVVKIKSIRN